VQPELTYVNALQPNSSEGSQMPDHVVHATDAAQTALEALRPLLRQVTVADLDRPTPCADYPLAALADHLVRSMVLLAEVAGSAVPAPGADDPLDARIYGVSAAAIGAWRRRGLAGEVAIGRSRYPAELAVEIVPLELLVHGWDMAQALDTAIVVPQQLAERMLDPARRLITADKRGKSFATEVPVPADAASLDRLVAFTGRSPLAA
jgi:uncharacterized protein (TIGR03086 family)